VAAEAERCPLWAALLHTSYPTLVADVARVAVLPGLRAGAARARALVRLALEKRTLYAYLDAVLADMERLRCVTGP
jgi:hypothetical protein